MYVLLKSHLPTLLTLNEFPQPVNLSPTAKNSPNFKTHPQSACCPLYKSENNHLPGKSADRGGVGLSRVTVLAIHLGKIILQ